MVQMMANVLYEDKFTSSIYKKKGIERESVNVQVVKQGFFKDCLIGQCYKIGISCIQS